MQLTIRNRNNYICIIVVVIVMLIGLTVVCFAEYTNCGVYNDSGNGWRWINSIDGRHNPVIYKGNRHENIECNECHHWIKDNKYKCNECHVHNITADLYHKYCVGCHEAKYKGPVECGGCHENKNIIEHIPDKYAEIVINNKSNNKGAVNFKHTEHNRYIRACNDCHHRSDPGKETSCIECHKENQNGRVIDFKEAYHRQCKGCHQLKKKGPTKCDECHQKK